MERAAGKGELIILWRNSNKSKQVAAYRLKVSFNHEGVQRCRTGMMQKHEIDYSFAQARYCTMLTLPEAVSLLQDAHAQNLRYANLPAAEQESYQFILEYSTAALDRTALTHRLLGNKMSLHAFVNVYLAAFRRMDTALLYDCSGVGRRKRLGPRESFILTYGEAYNGMTFLRSSLASIEIYSDFYSVDAFFVVITPEEEIMKIKFSLIIKECGGGQYCVERFTEISREILDGEHPDNPFNYWIHCSVFKIGHENNIINWLNNESGVLLTGETESCCVFKWLYDAVNPEQDFNINDKILAEYIVQKDELIIFAKKPYNLLQAEKKAAECAPDCLKLQKKYYMPVQQLYRYVYASCPDWRDTQDDPCCLKKYEAYSALLYLADEGSLWEYWHRCADGKAGLGPHSSYVFSGGWEYNISSFKEYYLSKNWLKVYAYGDDALMEIERLKNHLPIIDFISDQELANYFDLFNPVVSEQRKWYIYGVLRRFYHEKNDLHKLKLVASFEDVLRVFGTIKTG
jgi:hypothetical protein